VRRLVRIASIAAVTSASLVALTSPALAYTNVQQGCRSGTSGNVCSQLQTDGAGNYYARGAADPNPGYGIYLRTANLVSIYSDSFGTHYDTVRTVPGGNSMNYQYYVTSPAYPLSFCQSLYAYTRFSTVSGDYTVSTPETGRMCPA